MMPHICRVQAEATLQQNVAQLTEENTALQAGMAYAHIWHSDHHICPYMAVSTM